MDQTRSPEEAQPDPFEAMPDPKDTNKLRPWLVEHFEKFYRGSTPGMQDSIWVDDRRAAEIRMYVSQLATLGQTSIHRDDFIREAKLATGELEPDVFDMMPDPYDNKEEFSIWFNDLLGKINSYPKGYADQTKNDGTKYAKPEIIESFRNQLRQDVEVWTTPYHPPGRPEIKRAPSPPAVIKSSLRVALAGHLKSP